MIDVSGQFLCREDILVDIPVKAYLMTFFLFCNKHEIIIVRSVSARPDGNITVIDLRPIYLEYSVNPDALVIYHDSISLVFYRVRYGQYNTVSENTNRYPTNV